MESENEAKVKENVTLETLRCGDSVATPAGDISKCPIPEWFDRETFYKARGVYRKFYASINFCKLHGLLMGFYFPKILKTLASTGEFDDINSLFRRCILTVYHIQKWYEGDVWDVNDPAHKSLAMVRNMHTRAAANMAARNDGEVYISQWDMVILQWAFIGPSLAFPDRVGMKSCSQDELKALVHFWRVVGYLLGMEDKYNLCSGTYEEVIARCEAICQEYRIQMSIADPASVQMAETAAKALKDFDRFMRWASLATYIYSSVDLDPPVPMRWPDLVCYRLLKFATNHLMVHSFTRPLFNYYSRLKFGIAVRKAIPGERKKSRSCLHRF